MKRILMLSMAFSLFLTGFAQNNSKEILDKVSSTYSSNSGFILYFTLNTEDVQAKTTYSHDGKAIIKGNKFRIEVPDGKTWFDGKTQWVYMTGSDEVNVSNPEGDELAAISPIALLNLYKSGFKLSNKKETTKNGKIIYVIEMTPQAKGSEITKIILKIDKMTNYLAEITMKEKGNTNNVLIINKTEKETNIADNVFVFDKNNYPDVEVIDLR